MTKQTYAELFDEATEHLFGTLAQAQDLSLRATESLIAPVRREKAPASEAVDAVFGFAAKALEHQRRYAVSMTRILTGAGASEPKTKH